MKVTKEQLVGIIYESLEQVNEQLPCDQQIEKSLETRLIGGSAGLDSLAFVNFIALVEEKCARNYGNSLFLTTASSPESGLFKNVNSLADYLLQCLSAAPPVES